MYQIQSCLRLEIGNEAFNVCISGDIAGLRYGSTSLSIEVVQIA